MAMGGNKATEEELRTPVAQDSSIFPELEAAMCEPEATVTMVILGSGVVCSAKRLQRDTDRVH